MFEATASMGGIEINLLLPRFWRIQGSAWARQTFCKSGWCRYAVRQDDPDPRAAETCTGAGAQQTGAVSALVFVGDCMEGRFPAQLAGELGILSVPVFLFQDGADPIAAKTFSTLARLTRGRTDCWQQRPASGAVCSGGLCRRRLKALANHGKQRGGEYFTIAQLDSRS